MSRAVAVLLILCFPAAVAAQNVYRHVDENGAVTYSTSPAPGESPAVLPPIQREDIGDRIQKIKAETPPNCVKHGGADCSRAADADGSVICTDGFRDARMPYSLNCLEARLVSNLTIIIGEEAAPVRLGSARGIMRQDKERVAAALEKGDSLTLRASLRNMTAIAANAIAVRVRLPNRKTVDLAGPDHVEPFGAAEYEYALGAKPEMISSETLRKLKLSVDCQNCGAVSAASD